MVKIVKKTRIVLTFGFLMLAASFASCYPVKADSSDLWAVVVGVNGGEATHLDNDAIDFANVLTSVYGYPSSNIKLLTNDEATKASVITALEWLKNQESEPSGVSIFLSTHGDYDKLYLYDSILWDYELSDILADFESKNILVVINACHSGSFLNVADTISSGILITACAAEETTYDIALFANTLFVEYFVDRGMSQGLADENADGIVTVEEAYRYARNNCLDPPGALQPTHPQMIDNYIGDFNLSEPVHAPWFTSLPLALLLTVALLVLLRKKRAQNMKCTKTK